MSNAPVITTTYIDRMEVGIPFHQVLHATAEEELEWTVSYGSLPAGITLNCREGVLFGTPTLADRYRFTLRASSGKVRAWFAGTKYPYADQSYTGSVATGYAVEA